MDVVFADIDIGPAGVEGSHDFALSATGKDAYFQQGHGRNRLAQDLRQRFDYSEADAKPRERPRASGYRERPDIVLGEAVTRKQSGDLRNKLGGESAACEGNSFDQSHVVMLGGSVGGALWGLRQRDTAVLTRSIDSEEKHGKFLPLSVKRFYS